jgi:hypothetical protein
MAFNIKGEILALSEQNSNLEALKQKLVVQDPDKRALFLDELLKTEWLDKDKQRKIADDLFDFLDKNPPQPQQSQTQQQQTQRPQQPPSQPQSQPQSPSQQSEALTGLQSKIAEQEKQLAAFRQENAPSVSNMMSETNENPQAAYTAFREKIIDVEKKANKAAIDGLEEFDPPNTTENKQQVREENERRYEGYLQSLIKTLPESFEEFQATLRDPEKWPKTITSLPSDISAKGKELLYNAYHIQAYQDEIALLKIAEQYAWQGKDITINPVSIIITTNEKQ